LAQFAAETATSVGHWLAAQRRRRIDVGARSKHVGDPVTDLDVAGERRLRALIARRWPTHGFLGEETGAEALDRAHVWVVDPIDGTANFARDLQPWGVSIACMREGRPVAGAVYASADEVTVVAARAGGVRVDGKRVWMPRARSLGADSVVSTQWFRGTRRLPFLGRLLTTGTRIRVFGCTVVQLCDVVRGRLHANVQQQGRIWDIAAAGLIVEEAGGRFTGWNGAPIFPCGLSDLSRHHPSIAASPAVHRQIVRLLDGLPVPRA
jgi:myo-inositol-1(or 4)-monophosphatase